MYEIKLPVIPGDEHPKHIYLFGDEHVRETTCRGDEIELISFISDQILQNKDKIIDVFIEAPFRQPFKTQRNYIDDVNREFRKCLLQKDCQFDNARFHFVDIRLGKGTSESFNTLSNLYRKLGVSLKTKFDRHELRSILKKYTKYPTVAKLRSKKILTDEEPIKKEFNRSNIPEAIISHFKTVMDPQMNELLEYWVFLEQTKKTTINDWERFVYRLLRVVAYYVDIYTLLRIFKHFRDVKGKINKREPENIIIYMGEAHVAEIFRFLVSIGGKPIWGQQSIIEQKDYQCLDISGFKLPFFQ